MRFVELIEAVHDGFADHGLPHGFGGALALGQITDPRATVDIDVNAFVDPSALGQVSAALASWGYEAPSDRAIPVAGVRYTSATHPFPIDVFPSLDDRYQEVLERCVERPLRPGGPRLPFLAAVDLCVFKLSFNRLKDWTDLVAVAEAVPDLDVDAVEDLLVGLRGAAMHSRVARFRSLFAPPGG